MNALAWGEGGEGGGVRLWQSVGEDKCVSCKQRTLEVNYTFSFYNTYKDESNVNKKVCK